MKLYFIPSSVPELAALPIKERNRVWLHAKRSALKKEKIVWFCILLCGAFAGIGGMIGSRFASPYIGGPIAAGIAAAIGWFLVQPILIHASLPYVREAPGKP